MINEKQVILGMSGGVDSSTSALLLKQAGYEVHGVMLRTWRGNQPSDGLTDKEAELFESTRKIADDMGISFQMVDTREIFRRIVIGYFDTAYSNGLTPNPCMVCNREVKWATLMNYADEMGAKWVSTGHYARLVRDGEQVKLMKGRDPKKDQTYFLSHLSQFTLQRTLFPLGEYVKDEVRAIARENHISAVDRPESQDLCFLEGTDYRTFLLLLQPDAFSPGEIVDVNGEVIGEHTGLANYTIGQRKGLGVFRTEPLYVIQKDVEHNRLIVGYENELGTDQFLVTRLNWINGQAPCNSFHAQIKIRYQARLVGAEISAQSQDGYIVKPDSVLRDVTPGQFAVFYDGDTVLGGGTITV